MRCDVSLCQVKLCLGFGWGFFSLLHGFSGAELRFKSALSSTSPVSRNVMTDCACRKKEISVPPGECSCLVICGSLKSLYLSQSALLISVKMYTKITSSSDIYVLVLILTQIYIYIFCCRNYYY